MSVLSPVLDYSADMELNVGDEYHQHPDLCLLKYNGILLMKTNSWRAKDVGADIRFLASNFVTNLPLLL